MKPPVASSAAALLTTALLLALLPTSADAQRIWGRRGFSWQPEMELAKEEMARLQVDLDRLSDEEWEERALAWVRLSPIEKGVFEVFESDRVAELEFRKEVDLRPLGEQEPATSWRIDLGSEPQRKVALELTDEGRTRIVCSLGRVLEPGGALGVFQHDGYLVCLDRLAPADS